PQVTDDTLTVADWQPLAARAQWRLFRLFMWLWLFLATLPGVYFLQWWTLLIFAAGLPIGWFYARQYVRHTGWVIKQGILLYKHGWLTRRLAIVPLNRIQSITLKRSPFDRRYKMATVNVDTAGSASWGQQVNIAYLNEKDAAELARRLYENTEEI
ncbi:MAG TPA: PH domain-containing protein, partial [Gammaproteobacteria bacterium]|nr:PH domain-containing protein [Gammaproteobacteria bacterium]